VTFARAAALALLLACGGARDARAEGAASTPASTPAPAAPAPSGPGTVAVAGIAGPIAAGPLRIRYEPSVAAEARALAVEAPGVCWKVATELGIEQPPAEVFLARRARDMARGLPPGHTPPPWAGGVTWPREGLIAIALASPEGARQHLVTLLTHEYSHLALAYAAHFRPVPRWFVEGFAHVQAGERSWGRAQTLAYAAAAGRLQPLDRLDRGFPLREDLATLAYAEAYDFVGYLREQSPGGLQKLLKGIADGDDFYSAFRTAYGRTLGTVERDWQADVKRRYLWWPIVTSGTGLWMILSVLAVVAFVRRRRRQRERLAQMELEELPPEQRPN
jgi:hypothetical protein